MNKKTSNNMRRMDRKMYRGWVPFKYRANQPVAMTKEEHEKHNKSKWSKK